MLERGDDPLIVSIHSFTPKPQTGDWRDVEIGFLYKGDIATTLACHAEFKNLARDGRRDFVLGLNEPYSAFDLNYTVDAHVIPRGLRHLTLEIRQDLIDSEESAKAMAMIIAQVLKPIISAPYSDHHTRASLL
jgi:predicted N-formylglutamate amidohydrolase